MVPEWRCTVVVEGRERVIDAQCAAILKRLGISVKMPD